MAQAVTDEPAIEDEAFYGQYHEEQKTSKEQGVGKLLDGKDEDADCQSRFHCTRQHFVATCRATVGVAWNEATNNREEHDADCKGQQRIDVLQDKT